MSGAFPYGHIAIIFQMQDIAAQARISAVSLKGQKPSTLSFSASYRLPSFLDGD